MREEGFITADAGARGEGARASRMRPVSRRARSRAAATRRSILRQQFRDRFGGDHPPDWEVRTTFVPELQDAAERAVAEGLRRFGEPGAAGGARRDRSAQPADILALVGGRDFRQSQFNRATRSRRQPGSAFKPLLYAAALEHGYSPVSVLDGAGEHRAAGAGGVGAAQRRAARRPTR